MSFSVAVTLVWLAGQVRVVSVSAFFLITSRRIFRSTFVKNEILKMKTFIVYDLDSQMPVAVGEQVTAESARYCASDATGIFPANLLAEEIDLEKQVTY
jgi:hypothetical protein